MGMIRETNEMLKEMVRSGMSFFEIIRLLFIGALWVLAMLLAGIKEDDFEI